jgi:uncharacterized membrane protein
LPAASSTESISGVWEALISGAIFPWSIRWHGDQAPCLFPCLPCSCWGKRSLRSAGSGSCSSSAVFTASTSVPSPASPFWSLFAPFWALFTGLAIAFYSLVDKVGVGLVYPPVYIYIMMMITWLAITPWVLIRERHGLKSEWRSHKGAIVVVGFLSGFTYLMILFALTMSKVSYVAAVREISIVLSAYYGIALLGEKHGRQKLLGAVLITLGVIAIGLSR